MTQDLNATAAEIMGYELGGNPIDGWIWLFNGEPAGFEGIWAPTTDRNQAVMVLKRMEELGLDAIVECNIYSRLKYYKGFGWGGSSLSENNWAFLTCDPAIITQACVYVWEVYQEEKQK
jgi:hypothetical protein